MTNATGYFPARYSLNALKVSQDDKSLAAKPDTSVNYELQLSCQRKHGTSVNCRVLRVLLHVYFLITMKDNFLKFTACLYHI